MLTTSYFCSQIIAFDGFKGKIDHNYETLYIFFIDFVSQAIYYIHMESKKLQIIKLLDQQELLKKDLDSLTYGSIEIREIKNGKYIYLHKRINGSIKSFYMGEYTTESYNLIVDKNNDAKILKIKMRDIAKSLKSFNYVPKELSDDVIEHLDKVKIDLTETIHKQAVSSRIPVTFSNIETIVEGEKISDVALIDILKIFNLKKAWDFILNPYVLSCKTDYDLLITINELISQNICFNAGYLRSVTSSISKTNWRPVLPVKTIVKNNLNFILENDVDIIDKAIDSLLYISKNKLFPDNNQLTAELYANHILLSNGIGILSISEDRIQHYNTLLLKYFDTNNSLLIKEFLTKECIAKNDYNIFDFGK